MITAEQARRIADKNKRVTPLDELINKQIEELDSYIQRAISKGYYTVFLDKHLYPQVKKYLEENGYEIREIYRPIVDMTTDINEYIGVNISW